MTRSSLDIVVVGGANTDFVVRGEQLPKPGESMQGEQFMVGPGGKGANQAVAAARLGGRVAFIARIGCDARGDAMLETLRAEGVACEGVIRDADAPTGAAVIHVDKSGQKQIFAVQNANARLSADDLRHSDTIQQMIGQAKVLVTQLENPLPTVVEAAKLAQRGGAQVLLDPSPPDELPDELLGYLTLIKPNRSEAEALTGIAVGDYESASNAAQKLRERGIKAVAIQASSEGNLLVWGEEKGEKKGEVWLPNLPVESVDATGAGDALMAGFAVALAEGQSWEEAGHFATTAAALATTQMGAQAALPKRQAVDELMAERNR